MMGSRLSPVLVFFALSLVSSSVSASEPLSLSNCFERAVKRSESLAIQNEAVLQAEEQLKQAWGGILPSVQANASRKYQQELTSSTGSSFFPAVQNQASINLSQPLFRGMREYAALRQAEDGKSLSEKSVGVARLALFRDVAQVFYGVLSLEGELRNLRTEAASYEDRIKDLNARIRIGKSRVGERLSVEAAQATLNAQVESALGQLQVARQALAFQRGESSSVALQESVDRFSEDSILGDLEEFLKQLDSRPDVQVENEKVKVATEALAIAQGARLPNVDLAGNYFFTRPGVQKDSKWDVSAAISLPIYSGGVLDSKIREAKSKLEQAELSRSRVRRLADQEIRSAYSTVLSDLGQLRLLKESAASNQRNHDEQAKDYRFGLVTNLEVLQSLTSSQQSRVLVDRQKYILRNDRVRLEVAAAYRP